MRKLLRQSIHLFCNRQPELSTSKPVIQRVGEEILFDFQLINNPKASVQSIIVLNNELNS